MRSERKKGRAFLARFMVLMMVINLLSGINPSVARAADEDHFKDNNLSMTATGGINLTEKASDYSEGIFDVEMSVEGNDEPTTETKKLDVVLVVDTSNSMGEPVKKKEVYV